MTLELIEPGLMTMVQAAPYRGTRHLGMPYAGAADPVAMALANWLVGNGSQVAAIETAYAPLTFNAHQNVSVGIHGAANSVEINGQAIAARQTLFLKPGDHLKIPAPSGGCRSYIAIHGGISRQDGMHATSTYMPASLGGFDGGPASAGTILHGGSMSEARSLPASHQLHYSMDFRFRVTVAPESDWLDLNMLCGESRVISRRANRIGLELEGSPIKLLRDTPIDSSAVFPGTIQCPPSGLPFLLGPDAQTTGGYPRIAQVVRADRHLIGQLRPGARVNFQQIKPAEARRLYRSKIALIRQLQPDFRLD